MSAVVRTSGMVEALFADPDAVVTEAQVRALADRFTREVLDARADALREAARRIEKARNEHWQEHLREHPLADGTSCPRDYGIHDAYASAANIVRQLERVYSPGPVQP